MSDLNIFMKLIIPVIGVLCLYYLAHEEILTKWRNLLGWQGTICDKLISDLKKSNPEKLSNQNALHNLVGFVYYYEKIAARETLFGVRSFLIGLWLYVIGPMTYLSVFIYIIYVLSGSPVSDYIFRIFIFFSIIFGLVKWVLSKEEKKHGEPYKPEELIERIEKKICKDQKNFIIE